MKIRVETLTDDHDCETCGWSYAEGARVYFDDELVLDLQPYAHCYDGTNYSDVAIYQAILEKLGHEVKVDHSNDPLGDI